MFRFGSREWQLCCFDVCYSAFTTDRHEKCVRCVLFNSLTLHEEIFSIRTATFAIIGIDNRVALVKNCKPIVELVITGENVPRRSFRSPDDRCQRTNSRFAGRGMERKKEGRESRHMEKSARRGKKKPGDKERERESAEAYTYGTAVRAPQPTMCSRFWLYRFRTTLRNAARDPPSARVYTASLPRIMPVGVITQSQRRALS